MKKENKKMTLERLAADMARGFEKSNASLENLAMMTARGFEQVDKKFEQMDTKIDKLKDHLENRIDGLELKISAAASSWSHEFDRLHEWVSELDERMNRVEDKIAAK